ncbi:MAG: thermonuclease family protein [Pseudomonadota bacterium]
MAVAGTLIVSTAPTRAASPAFDFADPGRPPGPTVISGPARVIDGDTIEVAGLKIRLHGIDAPEPAQICRAGSAGYRFAGRDASAHLRRLTAGKSVRCYGTKRDGFGRLIAICRVGDLDLNRAMVGSGLAWAYRRYATTYVADEREARSGRRGVWAMACTTPEAFRRQRAEVRQMAPDTNCRIKGNISRRGRIYHLPGSRHYSRTRITPRKGERWFCSEAQARGAGWRAAGRR